ncbi:hypothetical protein GALMADRAFT_220034 [Galerina marginata CBS 339.88]|uniref:DUF5745 domain-containing protein n=1 Tax=Galerina marginata (strain CBS 339.88) TaxID=685588 RepID=A0A067TPJ0_GALM3|nr:hypothetical protein GALMADRAFT_220034 [Galerina marginata CBS 339.88]
MDISLQDTHFSKRNTVLDDATLVDQLNTLLSSLNIPITLISPTDLTPSLLVAILESVLGNRIPLIDRNKDSKNSKASKVQNMKIFLGVLELDVLKADVGLSNVDPRRLADGEWEEVMFVAEILCWMGRRVDFRRKSKNLDEELPVPVKQVDPKPHYPPPVRLSPKSQLDLDAESLFQTGSTTTGSTRQSRLMFSPFMKDSGGDSVTTEDHQDELQSDDEHPDDVSDVLSALPPFKQQNLSPPKCIHEVPSPSLLFSGDFGLGSPSSSSQHHGHSPPPSHTRSFCSDCDPTTANTLPIEHDHSADHSHTSVRYSGFIEHVDEESELASFESSRSMLLDKSSLRPKSQRSVKIEAVKEQYARTQQLLNQRARLLSQLAELKKAHG